MSKLLEQSCVACQKDAPLATVEQIETALAELPDWEILTIANEKQVAKEFIFHNFADALHFTNRVGLLSERENHHPALLTQWGNVQVSWWTHKIGGLHTNDFIMAAKTDEVY